MLLNDREELKGDPTWLLGSGLPLLNRRLAGIEVAGEDRLTDTKTLPQFLNLLGLKVRWSRKT